jgi:exopolysaccharide biosynthesis protein
MEKNEAKAQTYNNLLFQHSRLEEQIRQIKAENFDLSKQDVEKIDRIRHQQQILMAEVQKLF